MTEVPPIASIVVTFAVCESAPTTRRRLWKMPYAFAQS
jgi:hypothetical protein